MNKPVIIVVIVIILAVGAFFAYRFSSGPRTEALDAGDTTQNTNKAASGPMKGSIAALMAAGKSVSCTFEQTEASGNQRGRVYVAGTMMRGDFTTSESTTGPNAMHMIRDDEWQYVWGDAVGANQGIKLKIQGVATPSQATTQENIDINTEVDFTCEPWQKDTTLFAPPEDVTFQAMGQMMLNQNGESSTETPPSAANEPDSASTPTTLNCSACDQVPAGEMRQKCLQSLGC